MDNIELDINNKQIVFYKDVVVMIKYIIENFDINKLEVNLSRNIGFSMSFSYSFDGQNYSATMKKEEFIIDSDYKNVYIAVHFTCTDPNESTAAVSFYGQKNVDPTKQMIVIDSIIYNKETSFDLHKSDDVRYESFVKVVNRFPKWNFYDSQQCTLKRWLDQCDAMSEMYGHTCIYFKTEPVESETVHTFANHVFRNVVSIKRLKLNVPNNELPQDRSAYTDWDFMMQDDFIVHIVDRKFKLAFGEDKVPLSKDYLYLPITRKLYRVNAVQPKNGFMNVIGWWECFLVKYEEDECVVMSDEIKQSMRSDDQTLNQYYDEASRAVEDTVPDDASDLHQLLQELDVFKSERLFDEELVNQETTNEKKEVTQWFTNKAVDSTGFVSLKETEHQREMINKRAQIVNVNPDKNSFPVTMYDCTSVEKGNPCMIYNLKDYTSVNKQSTKIDKDGTIDMAFNVVFRNRYSGEMFIFVDIVGVPLITITRQRKTLQVTFKNNDPIIIDHDFEVNEFYNITLQINTVQLTCMIFKLENKQKTLDFQNVYKIINFPSGIDLYKLLLMGGQTLVNDIYLYINGKVVLKDNVNPVMVMRNFD